ncbi:hypothetical protein EGW08_015513 [Elysia chlorotica]|uniref:Uncharacterized protein n=1 Tax=Elysia chlorotica TaxID=188477 RepID=A0A433T581_ELYCH|nr:hypothetical protein EGW08_015513 [Elysia chlorotica]
MNASPAENSRDSTGTNSSQQARGVRASNSAHGRGNRTSSFSPLVTSIVTYFLLLVRDLLTFFVRGGISAMLFAMDQVLRVLLLLMDVVLGPTVSSIVTYPARMVVWLYQILLWVAYTMVELLLYLPRQVLIVYVIVLLLFLVLMPSPVVNFFKHLFTVLHRFIGLYKTVYEMVKEHT